jgi:hypothetical protein
MKSSFLPGLIGNQASYTVTNQYSSENITHSPVHTTHSSVFLLITQSFVQFFQKHCKRFLILVCVCVCVCIRACVRVHTCAFSRPVAAKVKGKGKAIRIQARTDMPRGFQEVETPRFHDNRHMKVVTLSALHTGCLFPLGNIPGAQFH